MDKRYIETQVSDRLEVLRLRYRCAVNCKDENDMEIKSTVAATLRSQFKRELCLCKLVYDMLNNIPDDEILLSDEALYGLDRLIEPVERHRRLKNVRI
jgi:hypothetical protein